jgi:hypothetical protein
MHEGTQHQTNFLFVTDLHAFRIAFFEVKPPTDTAQHYLLFWITSLLKSNLQVSTTSNTLHTLVAETDSNILFWLWNSASTTCFET